VDLDKELRDFCKVVDLPSDRRDEGHAERHAREGWWEAAQLREPIEDPNAHLLHDAWATPAHHEAVMRRFKSGSGRRKLRSEPAFFGAVSTGGAKSFGKRA
jgi:hypothetical protein